jgi:hypothetical protein
MNDEQLIAILAAVLSIGTGREPDELFENALQCAVLARKYVAENKRTQMLRMDYEIATPEKIEESLLNPWP